MREQRIISAQGSVVLADIPEADNHQRRADRRNDPPADAERQQAQ